MAITIMIYHLKYWLVKPIGSEGFLGKLGIYGVSIFFVLSGLSMAIVYSKYIKDLKSSIYFIVRRIFRIWPLLWVCIGIVVLLNFINGNKTSVFVVLANLTTIFGFIRPDAYINTGAWSIGNEMVFYVLTPMIIMAYERKHFLGNIILILSFLMLLTFSFFILDSEVALARQWSIYINPLNNLFLYVAGISLFYNLEKISIKPIISIILAIISFLIFTFYPIAGDHINIVTGYTRIVLVFTSILLVFSFYKFAFEEKIPKMISLPMEYFGIATYGVYLLHPLVKKSIEQILGKLGVNDHTILLFLMTVITTIMVALLSYNLFELKMIRIGKVLTSTNTKKSLLPLFQRNR